MTEQQEDKLRKAFWVIGVGLVVIAFGIMLGGCSSIEVTAYRAVVGGKAALVDFRSHHPECAFDKVTGLSSIAQSACTVNNRLTSAKDALIDAVEIYCGGGVFEQGGPCNSPKKGMVGYQVAIDKLQAAVAYYNQTAADLKGVLR